jgi:eukaryotic-like serine/threonine-protein kinase
MIWAMLAAALLLGWLLTRVPIWFTLVLLGASVAMAAFTVAMGGLERASGPLLAYALALGLLVPLASTMVRNPRVAPPRRRAPPPPAAKRVDRTKRSATRSGGAVEVTAAADGIEIPGYQLLEKVGSGGMASVYKARRADGQIVALKVPMEQYVADAKFIRRFHREAEVAQRLNHVNIVRTFEHGSLGTQHYMAMEYVDGRSLEGYIEAGDLTIDLAAQVMVRVTEALQHIHQAGIIHRDIKPANVMIVDGGIEESPTGPRVRDDAVKLMDFGIAGGRVLSRLTMTGARVGTPVYMSPEQARGLKIDHRSDIYSLGLVFYEMLTGQTAFKGGYEAIVHQQIFQTPPPPRQINLRVPKPLDSLVMRMIAKDPNERPSLMDVIDVLDGVDLREASDVVLASRILLTVDSRQGVVRILDTDGDLHASVGDIGVGTASFSTAPVAVAVDRDGHLFTATFEYRVDQDHHRMLSKRDAAGRVLLAFGPYGMKPGEFLFPTSIACAPDGSILVLDGETHLVQRFRPDGSFDHAFGGRGSGQGTFNDPRVVGAGPDGRVYVLDYGNRQVQRLRPDGQYETRWAFRIGADQPGMRLIDGFHVDAKGTLFVSDAVASKIRTVTADGKLGPVYAIEKLQGEGSDALLDLGTDDRGNLFAARRGGHMIRKYDPAGQLVETLETYAPIVHMVVDVRPSVGQAVARPAPPARPAATQA